MTSSVLLMAKDLTIAQIQAGNVSLEEMKPVLRATFMTLHQLNGAEQADPSTVAPERSVVWKKSIAKHAVTCLECGLTFKQLSARHLREHDLDGRSYRTKYGIPRAQSLSAHDVLSRRRQVIQAVRPWEKKGPQVPQVPQKKQRGRKKVS